MIKLRRISRPSNMPNGMRLDYRNLFHRTQYSIIMEDTDKLLIETAEELKTNPSLGLSPG